MSCCCLFPRFFQAFFSLWVQNATVDLVECLRDGSTPERRLQVARRVLFSFSGLVEFSLVHSLPFDPVLQALQRLCRKSGTSLLNSPSQTRAVQQELNRVVQDPDAVVSLKVFTGAIPLLPLFLCAYAATCLFGTSMLPPDEMHSENNMSVMVGTGIGHPSLQIDSSEAIRRRFLITVSPAGGVQIQHPISTLYHGGATLLMSCPPTLASRAAILCDGAASAP